VGAVLFVLRGFYFEKVRVPTVLGAVTIIAAFVVLIRVGQQYRWTGFGESVQAKLNDREIQPRKTLWDWLQLFIVPLVLAAVGLWFAAQQDAHQQQIEEKRAKSDRHIEEQRAQDAALQAYLDQMSQLMLEDDLHSSEEGSGVRTLARARTQTVLGQLDGRRKGSVVQFLYEASLINKEQPVVSLSEIGLRRADLSQLELTEADLSDADLNYADLSGAHLSGADLKYADLTKAILRSGELDDADLSGASLSEADLSDAYLIYADLSGAVLTGADLSGTDLLNANLSEVPLNEADLSGADLVSANLVSADLSGADLSGADLSGARGVTPAQLEEAETLKGATLPDGSIHD
jgi:uncharacterized protein YjbI with pentapeptide repeats